MFTKEKLLWEIFFIDPVGHFPVCLLQDHCEGHCFPERLSCRIIACDSITHHGTSGFQACQRMLYERFNMRMTPNFPIHLIEPTKSCIRWICQRGNVRLTLLSLVGFWVIQLKAFLRRCQIASVNTRRLCAIEKLSNFQKLDHSKTFSK